MTPTKEQYELAAKFMGYHLIGIGIFNTAVVSATNKGEFPWEPTIPGKHAYELLIRVWNKLPDDYEQLEPVGNDVLWWAKEGKGYTTDLSKAETYTMQDAQNQHNCRETDIPWPKDYIDGKTRPAVDMQYINRKAALANTGITINPPTRKREIFHCLCGRFVSEQEYYERCYHGFRCAKCD